MILSLLFFNFYLIFTTYILYIIVRHIKRYTLFFGHYHQLKENDIKTTRILNLVVVFITLFVNFETLFV